MSRKRRGVRQVATRVHSSPVAEKFTGELQDYKDMGEFREGLDCGGVCVGPGPGVYQQWSGVAEALVPVQVPFAELSVYVDAIDWSLVPPEGELCFLYHAFFKKYDREVLMLVGRVREEDKHLYFVPKQVGTNGGVDWEGEKELDEFLQVARWVGTIHVHPQGMSAKASGIDVDEWADPKKSGLHIVFGHDGSFNLYLALAGRTILVKESTVEGVSPTPIVFQTSQGKPLDELLLKPKVREWHVEERLPRRYRRSEVEEELWSQPGERYMSLDEYDALVPSIFREEADLAENEVLEETLLGDLVDSASALMCEEDDHLVSVEVGGFWYVLTYMEFKAMKEELGTSCPDAHYMGVVGRGGRIV